MIIFLYIIALLSFSDTANAQTSEGVETALALLREGCKYELGEELLSKISSADTSHPPEAVIIKFNLDILLSRRKKSGAAELMFGCNAKQSKFRDEEIDRSTKKIRSTTTAKEEIINQDSGGRYGRIIDWQRKYQGENFRGTVAHVDSIFGDGIKMPTAEQFYVCPAVAGFVCFSLIIDESLRLTEYERSNTVKMLQHIKIIPIRLEQKNRSEE
ncbi:hypothetical protein [Cupriavidus pinatubonensis]|uniref:Lipoprotein n=1 Tax=Cupriavidus pinatubonensis TaxID=248026 RepID=A0ABM8Y049_9BURK|nr:hypothetical protein [Cupriavidus pinatubonensis]CAG9186074.1 hypothetical protein LMG23994_06039 [Cupriavidus pinatubonensis]